MARTFVKFGDIYLNPWKVCYVVKEGLIGCECIVGFGGDREIELEASAEDVVAELDRVLARRPWRRGGGGREDGGAARRRPRLDSDNGTMEA